MVKKARAWFPGLEIFRGSGVLIVVVAHLIMATALTIFPDLKNTAWLANSIGNIFVEGFFAMSGFLLGSDLLRSLESPSKIKSVGAYAIRRWTRIVPAYYLILAILFFCDWALTGQLDIRLRHIFFVQAYGDAILFLGTAWTLAVEEWSYALLPLVIFGSQIILPNKFAPKQKILIICAIIVVFLIILRFFVALDPSIPLDAGIRKMPHLRLDCLLYGLSIACLQDYPKIFAYLQTGVFFLFVLVICAIFVTLQHLDGFLQGAEQFRLLHASLGMAIGSALASLAMPFLLRPTLPDYLQANCPKVFNCLVAASRYSYSLYLLHLPLFDASRALFWQLHSGVVLADIALFCLLIAIALFLCWHLTNFFWCFIEKPALDSRKFWYKLFKL